ncbi:MAG TPA: hypothetical protein VK169_19830 [Saprospiraceae bacterium]|nr:hypothetical protein [Saprospiraceae bacterium]
MNSISRISLILCFVSMTFIAFKFYPRWEKAGGESTLSWDAAGYYMYLPAVFIYKDLKKCGFKDSLLQKYQFASEFQQAYIHEKSGNYVMKYASGLAVVSLPFFAVGHIWASNSAIYPADGFSYPYQFSIGFGLFLVALLGMYFLRKILLRYYEDKTVAIILIVYAIGTNYINYAAVDQAMAHSTLFTVYAILIWYSIRFYETFAIKYAVCIGLLVGLATLIRPTELMSLLLPLLWGMSSIADINTRLKTIVSHFNKYALAIICFLAVAMIQPIYWKYVTGEWLVYSYGEQGFSWLRPHIYDYTFSYKSGWLRFAPMMILPFVGLWIFYKKRVNTIPVIFFFLLSYYVVTAWDVWDYGGRAMVQYYPILAFPFAALVEEANRKKLYQYVLFPGMLLLAYINVWWVYHAHGGQVQALNLSRAYYWAKVGRWTADDNDKKLLENKHVYRGLVQDSTVLYFNDFERDTTVSWTEKEGNKMIRMNKDTEFSPTFTLLSEGQFKNWMRIRATFHCTDKEWETWKQTQFICKFYNGDTEIQGNMIRIHPFINSGETKDIYIDAKVPKQFTRVDILFWHAGGDKELWIDNLQVITFDK